MAIKKVKLPNNSVVDINDPRIPGVDSTPTSGSTNVITSGGVQAALTNGSVTKIGTATVGSTSKPVYINAGVPAVLGTVGTSTMPVYLNSGTITQISSFQEAYLSWGGKNFSASYGPIDAAMVSELGACRTMFTKASAITIEYSTDGGTTWVDYGADDTQKMNLFSTGNTGFVIGHASVATASASNMLRVTLNSAYASIYTTFNKFVIYLSTNGSTGCYCTMRGRTRANYDADADVWTTFANAIPIAGWSGYNVINTGSITFGSNDSQIRQLQFIFGCTAHSSTGYAGLNVSKIFGFGGVGWTTPSNMAKTGHLYAFDALQNATFPAKVTATQFVKTNGTSSQFLKADGSVDSTAYSTTDNKVLQTVTTASNTSWRPLILGNSYSDAATFAPSSTTEQTYAAHLAKFAPSTGQLGVVGLIKMGTDGKVVTGSNNTVWNTNGGTTSLPSAPGTLITNATTAQTASSGEAMSGSITLHKVAKTGTYSDLIGKPTIPSAPGTLNTTATTAQSTSSSEALSGNITLHKVAKTGTYSDLIGKPTIPSAPGTLNTNNTTAQTASSSEALSGAIKLHKVSKTGSYNDLLNKPTIPTITAITNAEIDTIMAS